MIDYFAKNKPVRSCKVHGMPPLPRVLELALQLSPLRTVVISSCTWLPAQRRIGYCVCRCHTFSSDSILFGRFAKQLQPAGHTNCIVNPFPCESTPGP